MRSIARTWARDPALIFILALLMPGLPEPITAQEDGKLLQVHQEVNPEALRTGSNLAG